MTDYELGTGCYLLKHLLNKTFRMRNFPVIIWDWQDCHMAACFAIVKLFNAKIYKPRCVLLISIFI